MSFTNTDSSNSLTIFLVAVVNIHMDIALPCVVRRIEVSELCQERAWIF